jgi:membrane protease YdiL (CAAX protease family)
MVTMSNNHLLDRNRGERIILAILFAAIGSLILIVFSPLRPVLGRINDYIGRIILITLLLVVVWLVRKSRHYEKYWQIFFGLLVLAIAVSLDRIISIYLVAYLDINDTSPVGWALPKLNECAVIVCVVVLSTRLSGGSLRSIYIQKGNLKLGVLIGLIAFFIAAAGSIPMSALLFKGQNLTLTRITQWIPWLLIFVLANATLEELLFRGLFLQKLEPFYGRFLSNFMIAFVFTLLHGGATYMSDQYIFLAVVFPLALAWGYITQKTNALWGSILFHAGMDIPIMLGIFSNLS